MGRRKGITATLREKLERHTKRHGQLIHQGDLDEGDIAFLVHEGYLTVDPKYSWRWIRTDKPLPEPVYRRPSREDSFWPFFLPEHWDMVRNSPLTKLAQTAEQFLVGQQDPRQSHNVWAYRAQMRDKAVIARQYPTIADENYLKTLRDYTETLLTEGKQEYRRVKWLMSAEGVRQLLVILLVEPKLEGGKVVLVPLDPERQVDEWERVNAMVPDVRGEFLTLLRREKRPCRRA